jgi:hypothetical protein
MTPLPRCASNDADDHRCFCLQNALHKQPQGIDGISNAHHGGATRDLAAAEGFTCVPTPLRGKPASYSRSTGESHYIGAKPASLKARSSALTPISGADLHRRSPWAACRLAASSLSGLICRISVVLNCVAKASQCFCNVKSAANVDAENIPVPANAPSSTIDRVYFKRIGTPFPLLLHTKPRR